MMQQILFVCTMYFCKRPNEFDSFDRTYQYSLGRTTPSLGCDTVDKHTQSGRLLEGVSQNKIEMQFPRIVPLSWHQSCKDTMLRVAPTKRDFWLDRMISEMFLADVSTYFTSHVHIYTSFMSFSINFVLARVCFRTCHLWSCVAHSILPYRFSRELTTWD